MGDKEKFIADLYPAAQKIGHETGMSWELILAQAAQETGWGQRVLPGTNNIFNIKSHGGWDGESKTFNVWEIENGKKVWKNEAFRSYVSIEEALRDRVEFLKENPRYAKAGLFDEGTKGHLEKEAAALQKAGYATDPMYARQLAAVFNGPTMQRGIAQAMGERRQASNSDQNNASRTDGLLRQGEHGHAVRLLQESLTKLGYRDAHGRALQADSHFGARTEEALRSFQRAHGLAADGAAGPVTLQAIKQAERAPLLNDACHPDHALFKQAQACVHQLDAKHKRTPDHFSDQLSGALVVEAKREGFKRIDEVILGVDGKNIFAKEGATLAVFDKYVQVDTITGLNQSIARSSEQLDQVKYEQATQAAQMEQQRQQVPERSHGRSY